MWKPFMYYDAEFCLGMLATLAPWGNCKNKTLILAPTLGLHPILSTLGTTGYTLGLDLWLWNPAWVTQPPWLHQFCFRWTIAHPITKPGAVTEVEAHFSFLARPSRDVFFAPVDLPCSPNYPIQKKCSTFLFLYLCYGFFFQNSLSFCRHYHYCNGAIACCHRWCLEKN